MRDRYEEKGALMVRFGRSPKRAVLFHAGQTFSKISVPFAPMPGRAEPDKGEKLEFLCDGQQLAVDGIHPGICVGLTDGMAANPARSNATHCPSSTKRMRTRWAADCAKLLIENFGYKLASKPKPKRKAGGDAEPTDWNANLAEHDQLAALAMKLVRSRMDPGAVRNFLRAQVSALEGVDPDRIRLRLNEIPGMVDSAVAKLEKEAAAPQQPPPPPRALAEVGAAFIKWLVLKDLRPVYAVLGAVAANLLPGGDPVWLGIVAPPSSAKTEIINALSLVPRVRSADGITIAGLLSGTPKGQKAAGAKGGLLREVGDLGNSDAQRSSAPFSRSRPTLRPSCSPR